MQAFMLKDKLTLSSENRLTVTISYCVSYWTNPDPAWDATLPDWVSSSEISHPALKHCYCE